MDEEIERLVIGVRADTQGFARDVAAMRGELGRAAGRGRQPRGASDRGRAARARCGPASSGSRISRPRSLSVMSAIAGAAVRAGIGVAGRRIGRAAIGGDSACCRW